MHRFTCYHCGKSLKATTANVGKKTRCPSCNKTFVLVVAAPQPPNTDTPAHPVHSAIGRRRLELLLVCSSTTLAMLLAGFWIDQKLSQHTASQTGSAVSHASTAPVEPSQPTVLEAATTPPPPKADCAIEPEKDRSSPVEQAADSVALIETDKKTLGTGFIVKNSSLLATNFHVVAKANTIQARFRDGTEIAVDGFVACSKGHDLAVLHLSRPARVPPLELNLDKLAPGADVFAVGSPKGLGFSFSKGVVSAYRLWPEIERALDNDAGVDLDYPFAQDSQWVQTTTPISPGNSGGPLLGLEGTVVAINTLRSPSATSQNINFSVHSAHLAALLTAMSGQVFRLADLPTPHDLPSAKRMTPQQGNAVADIDAWDTAADAMGTFVLDFHELLMDCGVHGSREQARLCCRGLSAAGLVTLEKLSRIDTSQLSPVLAAYLKELSDSLSAFCEHTRELGRATSNQSLAVSQQIIDAPLEVLGVESFAVSERLDWVHQNNKDVHVGLPIFIHSYDFARAAKLSKQWPKFLRGTLTPLPPCPFDLVVDQFWDTYYRSSDVAEEKAALQSIVERFPQTTDAKQAQALLRNYSAPARSR